MTDQSETLVFSDLTTAVGIIGLNRPDRMNALNLPLIQQLRDAFQTASDAPRVRAIILCGAGKSFCAGGDISWMKNSGAGSDQGNSDSAGDLASMLLAVRNCRKPVIVVAQGPIMGGGAGLLACADIVIAERTATFSFSEVKLGLTPATISPFVIEAIGPRWTRRLFQTAERFGADQAQRLGLVHDVCDDLQLAHVTAYDLALSICQGAPGAVADAKSLVLDFANQTIDAALLDDAAGRIAHRRSTEEGQEGTRAFLEKRFPNWHPKYEG